MATPTYSESDFADVPAPQTYSENDFAPETPAMVPGSSSDYFSVNPGGYIGKNLMLPAAKWAGNTALDVGPQAIGAGIGGYLGSGGGVFPPGGYAGAGMGAGLVGMIERLLKTKATAPDTPGQAMQVLGDVGGGILQELGPIYKGANPPIKAPGVVSSDIVSDLYRAIKPINRKTEFGETLKTALPEVNTTALAQGKPIRTLGDIADVIGETKNRIWDKYQSILNRASTGTTPAGVPLIDGNIVADEMISVIDPRFALQNPEGAAYIKKIADTYRRPMTLKETESFLKSTNNDLTSYYNLTKTNRNTALGNPSTAFKVKEGDALRKALLDKLDALPGPDASQLRKSYGAVTSLEEEVLRRKNVFDRADPMDIVERLSWVKAAGGAAKEIFKLNPPGALAELSGPAMAAYTKYRKGELIADAFKKFNEGGLAKMPNSAMMRLLPLLTKQSFGIKADPTAPEEGQTEQQQQGGGWGMSDLMNAISPAQTPPEPSGAAPSIMGNYTPEMLQGMGYKKVKGGWQRPSR